MRFLIEASFGQVTLKFDIFFVCVSKFGKHTKYISNRKDKNLMTFALMAIRSDNSFNWIFCSFFMILKLKFCQCYFFNLRFENMYNVQ